MMYLTQVRLPPLRLHRVKIGVLCVMYLSPKLLQCSLTVRKGDAFATLRKLL